MKWKAIILGLAIATPAIADDIPDINKDYWGFIKKGVELAEACLKDYKANSPACMEYKRFLVFGRDREKDIQTPAPTICIDKYAGYCDSIHLVPKIGEER